MVQTGPGHWSMRGLIRGRSGGTCMDSLAESSCCTIFSATVGSVARCLAFRLWQISVQFATMAGEAPRRCK